MVTMGEYRAENVAFRMETPFKALAEKVANQNGITLSTYVRKLVIEDLKKRGLVDADMMLSVMK